MFKLVKPDEGDKPTYKWPVTIKKPIDGGKFATYTFNAKFEYLPDEEIQQVFENARLERDNGDIAVRALVGWGPEVVGADDQPLAFSEENKALMFSQLYVKKAVLAAFIESISGDAARRKN